MTTAVKLVLMLVATMSYMSSACAQQLEPELDTCILSNYQSGHQGVLDGTVTSGGSATLLHLAGCKYPVVVAYPSSLRENEKEDLPPLRQDENLSKLNSALKDHPTQPVGASLFGRLDVAKPIPEGATVRLGTVFDKSGKNIGPYGFGSPAGVYKYRLVLIQVNAVNDVPTK